jgi:hypothetical protein
VIREQGNVDAVVVVAHVQKVNALASQLPFNSFFNLLFIIVSADRLH